MQPNTKRPMRNRNSRNFGFIAVIVVVVLVVIALSFPSQDLEEISFSTLSDKVQNGEISQITVQGEEVQATVEGQEEPAYITYKEDPSISVIESLRQLGADPTTVDINNESSTDSTSRWVDIFLISFLPIIAIIGFFYFMMRQAQGNNNQAMGFGKSKARVYGNEKEKITFKEVAGSLEAKEELQEVVEFLKYPKKFREIGARIPKGVMMIGPPGTGKTMLARAVAGEAGVPFFSISGSEFVEMFVGVGASRVRDLFSKAKKNAPCIIFVDEIDAVGRRRGSGLGGGHDEREQTLNQILVEMDGFEQGTNVIVMAATNRPDVLDPALLRPGRFDRSITLDLPDRKDRQAILETHLEGKPADDELKLDSMAAKTAGMSGADLQNIANEAAILTVRRGRKKITNDDLDDAFEKVAIGPERKSRAMNEKEKELTAYHEGGHALVGHVLPNADPIHKVSIIPRGHAGGVTWSLPLEDKTYHSIVEFKDNLAQMLGGRMAEKMIYGSENVTTGASSDINKATSLARDMVTKYGMSESLPNQFLESDDHTLLLDREFAHAKSYSDETARKIDTEVAKLLDEAAKRAELVLEKNRKLLDKLKDELLKKETLDDSSVKEIFKGSTLPKTAKL